MHIPTIDELKRALHIQENIEKLQAELGSLFGEKIPRAAKSASDSVLSLVGLGRKRKKGKMSAAGRAAIVAAQKKRWAEVKKGKAAKAKVPAKKKRKISAAHRAAIVKAQKARWAKVKREKAGK